MGRGTTGQDRTGLGVMGWCGMGLSASPGSSPSPAVHDMIRITVQPESQVVAEGARVSLTCWATGPPGLTYQWFCGKQEVSPTSPCHAGGPGPLPG